jgi:hypothetical protein
MKNSFQYQNKKQVYINTSTNKYSITNLSSDFRNLYNNIRINIKQSDELPLLLNNLSKLDFCIRNDNKVILNIVAICILYFYIITLNSKTENFNIN